MAIDAEPFHSKGDLMRRLRDVERELQQLQTVRRLEAASIGAGGLRVIEGGRIEILDGDGNVQLTLASEGMELEGLLAVAGSIVLHGTLGVLGSVQVVGGGDITITDGGGLTVEDGGDVDVRDGGEVIARHANGIPAVRWGTLRNLITALAEAHGINVQADNGDDLFRAAEFLTGVTMVAVGQAGAYVDELFLLGTETSVEGDDECWVSSRNGFVSLWSDDDEVYTSYQATGSAANCRLTEDGRIQRSTSAARYKQDIEDLDVDPDAILGLRPRTWRDRADVAEDPDTDRWQVGLVAEEVVDAGLEEFVDFDPDGNPDAVAYDRLVVALIPLLRELAAGRPEPTKTRKRAARKPRRKGTRSGRNLAPPAAPSDAIAPPEVGSPGPSASPPPGSGGRPGAGRR